MAAADHVRSVWGDPDQNLRLLREPAVRGEWRAIIGADGRKVGVVLWQHPSREELDAAGLTDIPTSIIDIDIMIGEPTALGAGIGSTTIRLVAEAALSDPSVPDSAFLHAIDASFAGSIFAFNRKRFSVS